MFGKVETNKCIDLNRVDFWDEQERVGELNSDEVEARCNAKEEFKK